MSRQKFSQEFLGQQAKQKYTWDEPCDKLLALRVPESMKKSIKQIDNWQEKVRRLLAREIEEERLKREKYPSTNQKAIGVAEEKGKYNV